MSDHYTFDEDERGRDSRIDECKPVMAQYFRDHSEEVFYERQLQVMLESQFFHWVTSDTLHELTEEMTGPP